MYPIYKYLILLCWYLVTVVGVRPRPVSVRLCCSPGLTLDESIVLAGTVKPGEVAAACKPLQAPTAWQPRVFAPARNSFLQDFPPKYWTLNESSVPGCERLRVLAEHVAPYTLLANNGSLLMLRSTPVVLPPERYCVDPAAALVCLDTDDALRLPSKCCPAGKIYDESRCVEDKLRAERGLEALRRAANESGSNTGDEVAFGWPWSCPAGSQFGVAGTLEDSSVELNGSLVLGGKRLPFGTWCAEVMEGNEAIQVLTCESAARVLGVGGSQSTRHVLYGVGLAVGAAFLAATLAASFALPAAHHALHWRCQTHYIAALMVGNILLAVTQLAGDQVPPTLCKLLAICMHFLFLSAFFWLNTMCFNIWWTFRDFRPTSLERGQEIWRLRVYMVYAWGGPLALAGTAAILDHLPLSSTATFLRPRFAVRHCWFYGDTEILVYFFGPVGVLLLVNLALFISTTRHLTCGLWRRDEVKSTSERAALGRVCAKLVVVMGVTWGADVVSWACGGPEYVWYATDLLNALQGVLIFLVVGCQKHAWAASKRVLMAWCSRRGSHDRESRAARCHSSTQLPSCGESLTHTTSAAPQPPLPSNESNKIPMETVC